MSDFLDRCELEAAAGDVRADEVVDALHGLLVAFPRLSAEFSTEPQKHALREAHELLERAGRPVPKPARKAVRR